MKKIKLSQGKYVLKARNGKIVELHGDFARTEQTNG